MLLGHITVAHRTMRFVSIRSWSHRLSAVILTFSHSFPRKWQRSEEILLQASDSARHVTRWNKYEYSWCSCVFAYNDLPCCHGQAWSPSWRSESHQGSCIRGNHSDGMTSYALHRQVVLSIRAQISTDASCGLEEIFAASRDKQPLFYQVCLTSAPTMLCLYAIWPGTFKVYLDKDREKSAQNIQMADRLGARAIVLTVDVMRQSKRTLDVREKHLANPTPRDSNSLKSPSASRSKGISESIAGSHDFNLSWKDVDFIRVSQVREPAIENWYWHTFRRKIPHYR